MIITLLTSILPLVFIVYLAVKLHKANIRINEQDRIIRRMINDNT